MTQYKFQLSSSKIVTLTKGNERLFMHTQVDNIRFVGERDDMGHLTEYKPTQQFWEFLVQVNIHTSEMTQQIKHMHLDEEVIPDIEQWGLLTARFLPKYEERIAFNIEEFLAELRMKTNKVFAENPRMRELFRHAYTEATGEVPEYLCEFRY